MKKDKKIERYILQAKKFLQKADEELTHGDLRQASEKYWGAASQTVKAIAEKKGLRHDGHTQLFDAVDKISIEQNDDTLKRQFGLAGMLHTNFYEGWLTEDEVKDYGAEVKKLVDKINDYLKWEVK